MSKEITPENINKLCEIKFEEFKRFYPTENLHFFKENIATLMILLGGTGAPLSQLEFREALRSVADILEILYSDEKKN